MTSTLIVQRECGYDEGDSEVTETTFSDLVGTIEGNIISGDTIVCRTGDNAGLDSSPMVLEISADGKTLSGEYIFDGDIRPFSLVRLTVGECKGGNELLSEEMDQEFMNMRARVPDPSSAEGIGGGR